jgi:hypothetical protein
VGSGDRRMKTTCCFMLAMLAVVDLLHVSDSQACAVVIRGLYLKKERKTERKKDILTSA